MNPEKEQQISEEEMTVAENAEINAESAEVNEVTEKSLAFEEERAKIKNEVEIENLERGKENAMDKVEDWKNIDNFFHGTYAINFEGLITHGPDTSKAKVMWGGEKVPQGPGYLYFFFNYGKNPKELDFGNNYDIFVTLNKEQIIDLMFDGNPEKLEEKMKVRPYEDRVGLELSAKKALPPEVLNGVVVDALEPGDQVTAYKRKYDFFRKPGDWNPKKFIEYDEMYRRWVGLKMIQVVKQNPERALPVYDKEGNLLWPRKMSYERSKAICGGKRCEKRKRGVTILQICTYVRICNICTTIL